MIQREFGTKPRFGEAFLLVNSDFSEEEMEAVTASNIADFSQYLPAYTGK